MSKKLWIVLGLSMTLVIVLCAGGALGYFWYKARKVVLAYESAEQYYADGQWAAARRNYAYHLSKHPDDVETLLKYADACSHIEEDRPRAIRDMGLAYYQILSSRPNDTEAIRRLLEHYETTRLWADLDYYANYFLERPPGLEWSQYLEQQPGQAWILYYRALALDHLGRAPEALALYQVLIDQGTDAPSVYGNAARLLRGAGLEGQARVLLEKAVAEHPQNPHMYVQQVIYYTLVGKIEEIRPALEKARALDPEDPEVLLAASRLAALEERWDEAISLAERAVAAVPVPVDARSILLGVYQEGHEYEKAIAFLEGMDPQVRVNNPAFYMLHHDLLFTVDRLGKAEEVLDEYRAAYPDHSTLFKYMEGRTLLAEGNAPEAITKLVTVVETSPGFRQAQYVLAVAYLSAYQRQRARITLEALVANFPDDIRARALLEREFARSESTKDLLKAARDMLAQENATAGDLTRSADLLWAKAPRLKIGTEAGDIIRALLEKALHRDPSHLDAYPLLIDLFSRAGELERAQQLLADAESAGIESGRHALVGAWIALAQQDTSRALDLFAQEAARTEPTVNEVFRWANSFAARDRLDIGLVLLDRARTMVAPDNANVVGIEQIALSARFGDLDSAVQFLDAMASRGDQSPELHTSLNREMDQLIRVLMRSDIARHKSEAKRLVETLRREIPDDHNYRLLHARVLANQDPPDNTAARKILTPLLSESETSSQALGALADIAMGENEFALALEYAKRAAANAPQDVVAHLVLAEAQIRLKRHVQAQASLEHVLTIEPENARAMEMLLATYLATDRVQQAELTLARLESVATKSPEATWRLAVLRGRLSAARGEDLQDVEDMLRARYESDPGDFDILGELAVVMIRRGHEAEAEELVKDFTESHSNHADGWVMLGRLFLAQGTPRGQSQASSAFTRALIVEPNDPSALRGLIELHGQAGNSVQVLLLCDRYLELRPASPEILYRQAGLLVQYRHDPDAALGAIDRALAFDSRTEYLYMRASIYLLLKQPEDALADLQRVGSDRDVKSAEFDMTLAEAYWGTGNEDLTIQYLDSARRKLDSGAPGDSERLKRLESLLSAESVER